MNKTKFLHGLIFLTILLFLFQLNSNIPLLPGDDYVYSLKFEEGSYPGHKPISSFKDFWQSQLNHYCGYNNRIAPHAILQALLLLPRPLFNILNALLFLLLPLMILRPFPHLPKKTQAVLWLLLLSVIWLFHPALGNAYLWKTGAVNYSWMLLPQLYFSGSIFLFFKEKKELNRLDFLVACLIATSNEHVVLSLFICSLILLIRKEEGSKQSRKYLFFSTLALGFGGLLMLMSPALLIRFQHNDNDLFSNQQLLENLQRSAIYILSMMASVLILFWSKGGVRPSKGLFFLALIFCSTCIMIVTPLYEPRAAVYTYYLSFMLILSMIDRLKFNVWVLLPIALAGLSFIDVYNKSVLLDGNMRHNIEQLKRGPVAGDTLMLDQICTPSFGAKMPCENVTTDPSHINNLALSRVYNSSKIQLRNIYPCQSIHKTKPGVVDSCLPEFDSIQINHEFGNKIRMDVIYLSKNDQNRMIAKFSGVDIKNKDLSIIVRTANKNIFHYIYDLIPVRWRIYLLEFNEYNSEIVYDGDDAYLVTQLPVPRSSRYTIYSLYSRKKHSAFGKPAVINWHDPEAITIGQGKTFESN